MNLEHLLATPTLVPDPALPAATGVAGLLKVEPADFLVDEVPAYPASGEGTFLYVRVRKEDISGGALVRAVAKRLGIDKRDVGAAGIKDRRGITQQWLSVPWTCAERVEAINGPMGTTGSIEVVETARHSNKLKTGHLAANRFEIRVRGRDEADDPGVGAALEGAKDLGFPNTFGPQRFSGGKTIDMGMQVLGGGRVRDKRMRRLAVSAVQSALFNHWLAARAAAGTLRTVLDGDMLARRETGGRFTSTDPVVDQARLDAGELVLSGPLFGARKSLAAGAAAVIEQEVLAQAGMTEAMFAGHKKLAPGGRRPALAWPTETGIERDGTGLWIRFTLTPGTYATVLLATLCGASILDRPPRPSPPPQQEPAPQPGKEDR